MFKDIPGFEDYSVSKCGKVKSNRRGKLLSVVNRKDGYQEVGIRKEKVKYVVMVHRLVAMTYLPNPENKPCVNHKDSVRDNNHVDNLEWCTQKENLEHASRKGRLIGKRGETNYGAVMDNETCHEICKAMQDGAKLSDLSRKYSINIKTLSNIKNGKRWLDIRSQYDIETQPMRRLSEQEKISIPKLKDAGYTNKEIADKLSCTLATVLSYLNK